MKTRIFLVMLLAVALFSCQKEKNDPATTQDVTFTATQIDPGAGLKGTTDWDWKCISTLNPDYAIIDVWLNGVFFDTYYPQVFVLDNKLYTQAIKLAPGNYAVDKFLVMDDSGPAGYDVGDQIYMATPAAGAPYSQYTDPDVRFPFVVQPFIKLEVPVQVLCFIPAVYTGFGFDWFAITEIEVRELCFFGDICVKHPDDYLGSHYAQQPGGLKIDMPAIIQVVVTNNTTGLTETFTNDVSPSFGVGSALCVKYADKLGTTNVDAFTVKLYIMVKQGNLFPFVLFQTWNFNDISNITTGDDGVVDFYLGSCNLTAPDYQMAPWQNLPPWANVTILNPGTLPSYWDITFNSFSPAGLYDVELGLQKGWCGDEFTTIANGTFDAAIYSSLYNWGWPAGISVNLTQLSEINWLMNHLSNYGYDMGTIGGGAGDIIQQAIWNIIRGNAYYGGVSADMYNAAILNPSYVPLPGGWAAVLIIKDNLPDSYQMVFVVVDP